MVNDPGKNAGLVPSGDFDVHDALDGKQDQENGFVDATGESTIAFDDGTRTFTITAIASTFDFFVNSTRYTIATSDSLVIPDVEGLHYIYYDTSGTLTSTQTFTPLIITTYAFTAAVYWDATNSEAIIFADERHGSTMDSATHLYNHLTFGTRYASGMSLTNMSVDGSGDLAIHAQVAVEDGVFFDEDIRFDVTNGSPQVLSTIAEIPMFYRSGAAGDWRRVPSTTSPITTTGTGRAAWNEFTGGSWQLTEVANTDFTFSHLLATPDANHPIIGLIGQGDYNTIADARDNAASELLALELGPLDDLSAEFVPLATIIWQTANSYANAVKSRIRSTDDGADYIDWRTQRGGVSGLGGAVDHGALTGLTDDDHTQYLLADGTRAMTGALDMGTAAITNVGNVDGRDVSADGTKLDGIEAGATADENLAAANQILAGNRTVTIASGTNYYAYFNLIDDTGANNKAASVIVQPSVPRVVVTATETTVSSASFAVGSANINFVLTGGATFSLNGDAGAVGEVITSQGGSAEPVYLRPVELLGAVYTTAATAINTSFTTISWATPAPDTAGWTYSAGVFTVPSNLNGYYLEFNVNFGATDSGSLRAQIEVSLDLNTGAGYVSQIMGKNYAVRVAPQDSGGAWICGYVAPAVAATGDLWRVQVRRAGIACDLDPEACSVSIKAYPA